MQSAQTSADCNCGRNGARADEAESFLVHLLAKLTGMRLIESSSHRYLHQADVGHVAQLDRASDSGSESRGFESLHARILKVPPCYRNLNPIALMPLGSIKNPFFSKASRAIAGAETETLHPGISFLRMPSER